MSDRPKGYYVVGYKNMRTIGIGWSDSSPIQSKEVTMTLNKAKKMRGQLDEAIAFIAGEEETVKYWSADE